MSNPLTDKLAGRYQALEKSERTALMSLLSFFALLLVYFVIWSPVHQYYDDSLLARDRQLSLLQYMRSSENQARASANQSADPAPTGQSLLTAVSRASQQAGIKPNRLQPEGSDAVSVMFDSVAFDDLMRLLSEIQDKQGVVVRQISIDREDESGMVRARIVLRS